MKYSYLKRMLCIVIASTMISANTLPVFAEDLLAAESAPETVVTQAPVAEALATTPAPAPETVAPAPATVAPTAPATPTAPAAPSNLSEELSATEIPAAPSETPAVTPGAEPSETPTEIPEASPTEAPSETPAETPDVSPTEIPDVSPTETPEVSPTETPDVSPTETPAVSPTETPEVSPTATPTPIVTPLPINEETPTELVNRIAALASLAEITLAQQAEVQTIRVTYEQLSEEQKVLVTNYNVFVEIETKLNALLGAGEDPLSDGGAELTDSEAQIGEAVYYTNYVSNLHAGKEFYLNSLKEHYALTFSSDFASVMDEIEKDYKTKFKLQDVTDQRNSVTTTSEDTLLVRNWQDILAIYVYQHSLKGETSFHMSADSRQELAKIFAEMNPVERETNDITKVAYGNRHINYYIKKNNLNENGRSVLKKYTETDCKLLCAVVTAAKGFVRESVGDDVSEERVNVISAAYSLIGEVGYFYGGKSYIIGSDNNWGSVAQVTADGSTSTGTLRAYGLDCSGFVTWAVINGYKNTGMQDAVGDGTSEQWEHANMVAEKSAQPGDLVFEAGPELTGADNHVGILCGKTDAGDWIAVHCSSSKNGVTVGEAYSASFRYIRQPRFFPSESEVAAMEASGSVVAGLLTDGSDENQDQTPVVDDALVEPFDLSAGIHLDFGEAAEEFEAPSLVQEYSVDFSAIPTEQPLVDNSVVEPF